MGVSLTYLWKTGAPDSDVYKRQILQGNNLFAGTGHNSEIITDDEGNDWFFYHAWQKANMNFTPFLQAFLLIIALLLFVIWDIVLHKITLRVISTIILLCFKDVYKRQVLFGVPDRF